MTIQPLDFVGDCDDNKDMETLLTIIIIAIILTPFVYAVKYGKGKELRKMLATPKKPVSILERIEYAIAVNGSRILRLFS